MGRHENHHYVPAFLLRAWQGGSDNKLTGFYREDGRFLFGRYKAKSVAKSVGLYSLQGVEGRNNLLEEKYFGPLIDDPAAVAHQILSSLGTTGLDEIQRVIWTRFLVSLLMRTPAMVEQIRQRGQTVLAKGLNESPAEYLAIRGTNPEGSLLEWVQTNAPSLLTDFGVATLPSLVESEVLNETLLRARWLTRDVSEASFDLLICDNPLIYVGTMQTSFLVALPISPQQVFFASNEQAILERVTAAPQSEVVRRINLDMVTKASGEVYARDSSQARFVAKYLRQDPA